MTRTTKNSICLILTLLCRPLFYNKNYRTKKKQPTDKINSVCFMCCNLVSSAPHPEHSAADLVVVWQLLNWTWNTKVNIQIILNWIHL